MATVFPTSLDIINDPTATTNLGDTGFEHDIQHDFANDAIRALEAKVGIDGSVISSTLDYVLHNHAHSGTDGTVPLSATTFTSVSIVASGPTVNAIEAKAAPMQTADIIQAQNSAGTGIAGITGTGILYSEGGLTIYNSGLTKLLNVSPSANEVSVRDGGVLKGYTGDGTGQQYALSSTDGSLQLGGPTAVPAMWLNAYRSARFTYGQADAKNNANSGGISWQEITNADSPSFNALTQTTKAVLQKTSDGSLALAEEFTVMGFPTFDGTSTATKSIAMSVVPGVLPTMVAGTVVVAGKMAVSDIVSLAVPPVLPSSAYAPSSSTSGVDTRFSRADHTHSGQVGGKAKFTNASSGNYNISSTAWVNLDTTSDLVVAAKVGDWIEVGLSALSGNELTTLCLDAVSVVSGANVNAWGSIKTGSDSGIQAWLSGSSGIFTGIGGGTMKQVVTSDLDFVGNVTVRLLARVTSATNKSLYANAGNPFVFWIKNLGQ